MSANTTLLPLIMENSQVYKESTENDGQAGKVDDGKIDICAMKAVRFATVIAFHFCNDGYQCINNGPVMIHLLLNDVIAESGYAHLLPDGILQNQNVGDNTIMHAEF